MRSGLRLADGSWLLVGERGERWHGSRPSFARTSDTSSTDEEPIRLGRASETRLPETVSAVVRRSDSRWVFVGESGTLYTSQAPLGPCSLSTRPPVALTRVVGTSDGLIGLDASGGVLHYREGAGWSRAAESAARVFDVASTADGTLLGLTAPEGLLVSRDGGRRWSPLGGVSPSGAQGLGATVAGTVLVQGVHQQSVYNGQQQGLTGASDEVPVRLSPSSASHVVAERGPRVGAVAERQAALTGSTYYEAFEAEGDRHGEVARLERAGVAGGGADGGAESADVSRWLWASGPLHQTLSVRELGIAKRCDSVRLAASGRHVVMACVHFDEAGDRIAVDLHTSDSGGSRWRRAATLTALDTEQVAIAVSPNGSALLVGVCPYRADPCTPQSPLRMPPRGSAKPTATQAPELTGTPTNPVFSLDGTSAYFLGRRVKDDHIALFVSGDGGRSFEPRPLADPRRGQGTGEDDQWDLAEQLPTRSLHPGAEGELGIVLQREPPVYVTADRDGRIAQVARLPEETLAVSGSGRRVLALGTGAESGDHPSRLVGWESNDGGVSFRRINVSPGLEVDEFDSLAMHCGRGGCIVGARATRIGWGASDEQAPRPLEPPEEGSAPTEPAIRPPFECTLDETADWSTVGDVAFGGAMPSIGSAMRGDCAWSALQVDDGSGKIVAMSASVRGTTTRKRTDPLFESVPDRTAWAYQTVPQLEGYAAARAALRGPGSTFRGAVPELELAWIDYVHGRVGRAVLPVRSRMAEVTPGARPALVTGLLSVSPLGVFVKPSDAAADLYLVPARGVRRPTMTYPDWPPMRGDADLHDDAIVAQGTPLAIVTQRNDGGHLMAIGIERLGGSDPQAVFTTVTPPHERRRQVSTAFSYLGDTMGVSAHVVDLVTTQGWATFSPLTAAGQVGPPVPQPTQLDVGDHPRACSSEDRKKSPRLQAPYVSGTRHPVLVRSLSESYVLLTDWAVLHGTPDQPCVAAWSAQNLQRSPTGSMVALISGDPTRAWLFRPTPGKRLSFDYRPMRCSLSQQRQDPKDTPRRIWLEGGTMVRR